MVTENEYKEDLIYQDAAAILAEEIRKEVDREFLEKIKTMAINGKPRKYRK